MNKFQNVLKITVPGFMAWMIISSFSWGVLSVSAAQAALTQTIPQQVVENLISKGLIASDKIVAAKEVYALRGGLRVGGQIGSTTISYKATTTISWDAPNATYCTYSVGGQKKAKAYFDDRAYYNFEVTKTVISPVISTTTIVAVTCFNEVKASTTEISTIYINSQADANIAFKMDSVSTTTKTIAYNNDVNLSWIVTNGKTGTCKLDGNSVGLVSSKRYNNIKINESHTMTCNNEQGKPSTSTVYIVVEQPRLPVVTLTANSDTASTSISYRSSANLVWSSNLSLGSCTLRNKNTNVHVSGFPNGNNNGSTQFGGSVSTGILSTSTEYLYTCTNAAGTSTATSVIVRTPEEKPTVDYFKVGTSTDVNSYSQTQITVGYNQPVTLAWSARGTANYCELTTTLNNSKTRLNNLISTRELGNQTISSTQTLTCYNNTKLTNVKIVNINVNAQNAVHINMRINGVATTTASVGWKTDVSLAWNATNARSSGCRLDGGVVSASSTRTYSNLEASKSYTIVCENEQNVKSTSTAIITVVPVDAVQINNFIPTSATLRQGGTTTLAWATVNAVSCDLKDITKNTTKTGVATSTSSYVVGPLYKNNDYSLTCKNRASATTNAITSINVSDINNIISFNTDVENVAYNGTAKLYWTTSNLASGCDIKITSGIASGSPVATRTNVGKSATTVGYAATNLATTTTFSLVCKSTSARDSDHVEKTVTVTQPDPAVATLSVNGVNTGSLTTLNVPINNSAILSWTGSKAESCTLKNLKNNYTVSGFPNGNGNTQFNGNVSTGVLSTSTTYAYSCKNKAGNETTSTVFVEIGQDLPTVTFGAVSGNKTVSVITGIPSTLNIVKNSAITLSWSAVGTTVKGSCKLNNVAVQDVVYAKTISASISTQQVLTCKNSSGNYSARIININTDGPTTLNIGAVSPLSDVDIVMGNNIKTATFSLTAGPNNDATLKTVTLRNIGSLLSGSSTVTVRVKTVDRVVPEVLGTVTLIGTTTSNIILSSPIIIPKGTTRNLIVESDMASASNLNITPGLVLHYVIELTGATWNDSINDFDTFGRDTVFPIQSNTSTLITAAAGNNNIASALVSFDQVIALIKALLK